ncbi:hypothetical protein XENTR_v10021090 [Xenopus tropicalis]|nr:hypothetical protein XENTR_v10021090 [Xenopus tropicalis]
MLCSLPATGSLEVGHHYIEDFQPFTLVCHFPLKWKTYWQNAYSYLIIVSDYLHYLKNIILNVLHVSQKEV